MIASLQTGLRVNQRKRRRLFRTGPRGRADFRRPDDIIHLAMDVSTTEEKQRQCAKRQRSKKDCESENGFHKLRACCWCH